MTDETGKIISWDNYEVMNVAIKQIEAIRVSVSGRSEILFTPEELRVIDRYADYDRKTTMGKLDAGDQTAILYTRDTSIMRKVDALVIVSRGGYLRSRE